MKIFFYVILFISAYSSVSAEIGILPFRVDNPSASFESGEGIEYAKLLSVAALLKKDMDIHPPEQLFLDMKRMKTGHSTAITDDQLKLMGKSLRLRYMVLGTLSRSGGEYISDTVLYSVREERVLFRNRNSSSSLFRLAESDVNSLFTLYSDRMRTVKGTGVVEADTVFLIDLSYSSIDDWTFIKEAIVSFASEMIDSNGIDTRIYLVPYSERVSPEKTAVSQNSILSVRQSLESMNPAGPPSDPGFQRSFRYAVQNVRWRKAARKSIFILASSPLEEGTHAAVTARAASGKGIKIHAVKSGGLNPETSSIIDSLTRFGSGDSVFTAYNQKVFGPEGDGYNLYYQAGRAFEAFSPYAEWREGVLKDSRGYGRDLLFSGAEEILQKESGITPYNMAGLYDRNYSKNLIRKVEPESNIKNILVSIIESELLPERDAGRGPVLARVLLSDEKVSFWASVRSSDALAFFEGREAKRFYFPLAVSFSKDRSESHGLSLNVEAFDIESGYIPVYLKKGFTEILADREKYLREGLLYPPVWFVDVRVEEMRKMRETGDIRD